MEEIQCKKTAQTVQNIRTVKRENGSECPALTIKEVVR